MLFLSHRWPIHLCTALGLSTLALTFNPDDAAEVYPVARLLYLPILTLALFPLIAWLSNRFLWPVWGQLPKQRRNWALGAAGAALAASLWLVPPLQPDFAVPRHVVLSATGEKGKLSAGTTVLIREIKTLAGRSLDPASITLSPDWQTTELGLLSSGAPDSRLEIQSEIPAGLELLLQYSPEGGLVWIQWDGQERVIDLFAREPAGYPLFLRGGGVFSLPFGQALAALAVVFLYAVGLGFPILVGMVLFYRLLGELAPAVLQWAAIGAIALLFILLKSLYLTVDDPHLMGDSLSYVVTAEHPLSSALFWLGQRPFTIPLGIKLFGFTTADYFQMNQLARWANFQTTFSAIAWGILALTLAWTSTRRFLRVLLFAMVLFCSLSMEISLWDALLLSESLSFSFLALMLAGWLGLVLYLPGLRRGWLRWSVAALTVLVTILYAFGRDSNIYYVLAAAAVLVVGSWLDPRLRRQNAPLLAYAAAVVIIFAAQFFSLNAGNRWQVFIYDHLGMRILLDPEATAFFAERGLPLSDPLMEITGMKGSVYQKRINESPELRPVKDWVACCGKSVYIEYLLSDPLRTLTQPYLNWQPLLNGSLRGYRNPHNGIVAMPGKLLQISNFFFKVPAWGVAGLALACLTGLGIYLRRRSSAIWLFIAALALPVLPMMGFIWWAEPMEIDRHAAQIIIQFRLAGFIALVLLADLTARQIAHLDPKLRTK